MRGDAAALIGWRFRRRCSGLDVGPANVLQRLFAKHVGITFTGLGKSNDLVGDGLFNVVGAVADPQCNARNFEG